MTNNKHKKQTKRRSYLMGGKVMGSGGFGCIFRPALKCKNTKRRPSDSTDHITKLMKKKNTQSEYTEVMKYRNLLKNIPHYSDYFLLEGFSVCSPAKLSKKDFRDFDEKCNALKKMGISESNINDSESLDQLLALNMPYGGIDVSKYIDKFWSSSSKMVKLNNSLISLLENGIIPMNKAGVFHCDLKSSNILAREEEGELRTRLIDWGLSTTYDSGENVPKPLLNRPFQYNVPFSNILFTALFTKMYKAFLDKHPNPDYYALRTFVINYVLEWVEERGPGHLRTMNEIFKNMFEHELKNVEQAFKSELIEYDYTFYFIFEYITKILVKFTKNGVFDKLEYLNTVYLKNIDVWGLVVSYIPIIEDILSAHKRLSNSDIDVLGNIRELFLLLIEADDHPVDIDTIIKKLRALNGLLKQFKHSKIDSHANLDSYLPTSTESTTFSNKQLIDELKTTEKNELSTKSLSHGTRKILKKRKFHKKMVKKLKTIKNLHSKRAWI
jgi:serine/threonine protein kinase